MEFSKKYANGQKTFMSYNENECFRYYIFEKWKKGEKSGDALCGKLKPNPRYKVPENAE